MSFCCYIVKATKAPSDSKVERETRVVNCGISAPPGCSSKKVKKVKKCQCTLKRVLFKAHWTVKHSFRSHLCVKPLWPVKTKRNTNPSASHKLQCFLASLPAWPCSPFSPLHLPAVQVSACTSSTLCCVCDIADFNDAVINYTPAYIMFCYNRNKISDEVHKTACHAVWRRTETGLFIIPLSPAGRSEWCITH